VVSMLGTMAQGSPGGQACRVHGYRLVPSCMVSQVGMYGQCCLWSVGDVRRAEGIVSMGRPSPQLLADVLSIVHSMLCKGGRVYVWSPPLVPGEPLLHVGIRQGGLSWFAQELYQAWVMTVLS
jgi:hypothetical protein